MLYSYNCAMKLIPVKAPPDTWRSDIPMTTNPFRFFLFVSRPHWKPALVAICAVIVGSTLYTMVAFVFKMLANSVAALPDGGYGPIFLACGAYVFVLFTGQLAIRVSGFAGSLWATGGRATARYSLTAYITLHSRAYFSDRFAGSLANKITHAASGTRQMVESTLWQFLDLAVAVVASFVIAYFANPLLAWIFSLWVLVALGVNVFFSRMRVPLSSNAQKLETVINGSTVDLLSNITAMQEYARRLFEIERIKSMVENRRQAGLRNWHFGEWVLVLNGVLQTLFGGAMAFAAVYFAKIGIVSVGDIILVVTLIFRIEGLLVFLGSHLNSFAETIGEVQESLEEILEPHEIPDRPDAVALAAAEGQIEFDSVTFAYDNRIVFKDLSLVIPARQRVGLVGRSGAGKSTLVRLLLHHHDIVSGAITIDGTDIASVTQESLRNAISVVPQEPLLFHRSIRENIAYGNPTATEEEVIHAATLAQAHDFIARLPGGYGSLVGERGVKLSGGERQRIAIARAILKNSPILLLDEATSALDSESEVEIQKALHELMQGKTVIAIAHRLSTLREMDRIIVIDQGKIMEEGSHAELVAGSGIYSELWRHQAGGFLQD
ncbi:MAG: multidrug resistance transporter ATP-binding protein [Candidatus Kaiserbacteria bacterium]|nr:multidrug resistance transporter ATP-binding protein [Candidatus Kaiserbacteria bacterium]